MHGMRIDNLVGARVGPPSGGIVRVGATGNSDLLWALRGGGDFGVVTAFEFGLHELGPEVASLYAGYPVEPRPRTSIATASAESWVVVRFSGDRRAGDGSRRGCVGPVRRRLGFVVVQPWARRVRA